MWVALDELRRLNVHPRAVARLIFFVARGRRREGIGRRAIGKLFTAVWPAGKRLTVSVLTSNIPAISFWLAMGYKDYSLTLEILPKESQEHAAPWT